MAAGTSQPRFGRAGSRRLATTALALVLVVNAAACARRSSGVGAAVRAAAGSTTVAEPTATTALASTPRTTTIPATTRAGPTTTRAASATTRAAGPTTTTLVGAPPEERCPVPAGRVAEPTVPDGTATSSAALGVRVAHPTSWKLTDLSLTADQLFNRIMLEEIGLPAAASVKPLAVRTAAEVPGIAIIRVPRPSLSLLETTFAMADFYRSRRFVVPYRTLTACLDGYQALGLTATNDQLLQVSWFIYRGDFMYYVLGLENDGKTARSQADAITELNTFIETLRWLG